MCSTITSIHSDILESHILNKLDAATLSAASCASSELLSLCTGDYLWMQICNSTWPSTAHPSVRAAISSAFPSRHFSFYSDSFPARSIPINLHCKTKNPLTPRLISAVDIFFDDRLLYSKVLQTETLSDKFLRSSFRVHLLGRDGPVAVPLTYDGEGGRCMRSAAERLRVSWILIDPTRGRAVSVASGKAVEVRWEWVFEDKQLRYATVVGEGEEMVMWRVEVNCGGDYGGDMMVREVRLEMEDAEGRILKGLESLVVIEAAMGGERRRRMVYEREREVYEMFVERSNNYVQRLISETRTEKRRSVPTDYKVAAAVWIFCVLVWNFIEYLALHCSARK